MVLDTFNINKINGKRVQEKTGVIRVCRLEDLDDIFNIETTVLNYLKINEKGYMLPFKT